MSLSGRLVLGTVMVTILTALILTWSEAGATLAGVIALILLVGGAALAGSSLSRPINQLTAAARAIAVGEPPRFPRSPIPEVEGLTQALRQTHRELTDRFEEIQLGRAASGAIVDAMSDGVVASDGTGRIVIANPAARRLLSYGTEDTLPPLQALFRAKAARDAVSEVLAGDPVQDREVERDGRVLAINARSIEGAGAVIVLKDLTEVRKLEAVRQDFVANVSHELKTPLTSISGYAETLADASVSPEDRTRFLKTIQKNASRMQTLVDDLLDLSRIESGSWEPRPETVELGMAVPEAWLVVADRAAAKSVVLKTAIPTDITKLYADPSALRQILSNLFDNAIRYVDEGGVITLSAARANDATEITVHDDGTGIPAEHLPRIFERFYRVDPSRSRDAGGTGLGLSIVRHMVEAHGGRAWVESVIREGTQVSCRFPDPLP